MKKLQKLICGFLVFVLMFIILPIPAYAEETEVCAEGAHVWGDGVRTEATDDAPASLTYTCSICGQTKVEEEAPIELPCEHSWDDGVSSETVIMYTCTLCGETKTEELPAVEEPTRCAENAHVWDNGVISEMMITYTCTVCGETKTENIPLPQPSEEDLVEGVAIDATNFPDEIFRSYVIDFAGSCSAYVTYSYDIGEAKHAEFVLAIERTHMPGHKIFADYTECGGGWIVDHYQCLVCNAFCDEKGEELFWDDVYKEGTGHHTANLNQKSEANYTECSGGWIVDYYSCKNCNQSCLIDGSELDWENYYKKGTGKHVPDIDEKWEPNYTKCGGGWIITRYPCKNCKCGCLIDGTEPDYQTYHKDGNGLHTANLSQKYGPDYTECGGGWTVEYYSCEKCNHSCLQDGTELDHEKHYKEGTGKHTPGFEKEPTYTECGGGYITLYHECVVCGEMCDAGGNELIWSEIFQSGNGKHTPGKVFEPNFTECGTGYKIPYVGCVALSVLAVVMFIGGQVLGGCVFLVLAFLVSPYGIPAIADWLEDKLHSLNNSLWRFISV